MNATKRKFNALLNGLGNKSTTSLAAPAQEGYTKSTVDLSSNATETDSYLKRRRISQPSSTFSRTSRQSASLTQRRPVSATPAASITSVDPPKYAPWDREAFLHRLRSFSNITDWTPKPNKVNEVEWAKRGWVCQKFERVRCCLCNIEILVKLNKKEVDGKEEHVLIPSMIEEGLVDRYADLIITAHAEHCLWRQRGCDDTIFKLSLNNAPNTIQALRERYNGLCDLRHLLPYMHNIHLPENFDLDTILRYLPKDIFETTAANETDTSDAITPKPPNLVVFSLALFGWRNRVGHMPKHGAVICDSCFRTLGLWLFKSREVDDTGAVVRPASMNWLDPINEHRDYCPWRNAQSQSGDNSSQDSRLAAWEVLVRVLRNDNYLKSSIQFQSGTPRKTLSPRKQSNGLFGDGDDEAAKELREEQDKERWARLRRVKSLFESKSTKARKGRDGLS